MTVLSLFKSKLASVYITAIVLFVATLFPGKFVDIIIFCGGLKILTC